MAIKEIKSKELKDIWDGKKPKNINDQEYKIIKEKLLQINACNEIQDIEFLNAIILSNSIKERRKSFVVNINIPKLCFNIGFDFDEIESNIYDVELVRVGDKPIGR